MTSHTLVLLYGHDRELLKTRRWILEQTGHQVVTATELEDISSVAVDCSVDLLLFCHTLTLEECGRALALACTRWPLAQSLFLTAGAKGCFSIDSDKFLDTSAGPAMLVRAVDHLVEHAPPTLH